MTVHSQRQSRTHDPQRAADRRARNTDTFNTGRRSARHQAERLSAAESRRLGDALAEEVAAMTAEELADDTALFAVAQRFVHKRLASRAPNLSRVLATARAGVIDSFMVRWT